MSGRIGSQTSLVNAKTAGVTFRIPKRDRRYVATLDKAKQERKVFNALARRRFDITPRLVKP